MDHLLFSSLSEFLDGELGRIFSSIVVIIIAITLTHLNAHYYAAKAHDKAMRNHGRQQLVLIKNIIILTALAFIAIIWATKIAGVAISLSAFAVAVVISTKELIMCITGYIMFVMSRPFNVGDHIEIDKAQGVVVDVDLLNITLSETNDSQQVTGKTIILPNSILLTAVVINHVGLSLFVVGTMRLAVPYGIDRTEFTNIATDITAHLCEPWTQDALHYFQKLSAKSLLDAPSNKIEVFWESVDIKYHLVEIRFFVPAAKEKQTAQKIQHQIWQRYGDELIIAAGKN